jgi:hypothetical protein
MCRGASVYNNEVSAEIFLPKNEKLKYDIQYIRDQEF